MALRYRRAYVGAEDLWRVKYDSLATYGPLGPLGFDFAQHRQPLRPSVDGIRSPASFRIAVKDLRDSRSTVV